MEITPEQREKIEKRQVANILAKLNAGKSITAREQRLLDEISGESANFARSWDELAKILGVTRRTIQGWRRDPRYKNHCPKDCADGRKDINAWKEFVRKFQLKNVPGQPEHLDNDGQPPKAHWDRERSRIDYERALFNLDIEKKRHVELDEICVAVGQMLAGFRTAINMLPGSAARWLIGLKDFHAIKSKLESEVDGVLQSLGRCKYLEFSPCEKCAPHFIELGKESIKELQIDVD